MKNYSTEIWRLRAQESADAAASIYKPASRRLSARWPTKLAAGELSVIRRAPFFFDASESDLIFANGVDVRNEMKR